MDHLKSLICGNIFSRLDYCNGLFYGLNASSISKLQRVQNAAARLIKSKCQGKSLDDVFADCHWLKIPERVIYKILTVTHKCIIHEAPETLCLLINFAEMDRTLRLCESRVQSSYGDRAFGHVAPKLWNLLPFHIRNDFCTDSFKKKLKSFLLVNGQTIIAQAKLT